MQKGSLKLTKREWCTEGKIGLWRRAKPESGYKFIFPDFKVFQIKCLYWTNSELKECTNTLYSQLYHFIFNIPSSWNVLSLSLTPSPTQILIIFLDWVQQSPHSQNCSCPLSPLQFISGTLVACVPLSHLSFQGLMNETTPGDTSSSRDNLSG